MDIKYLKGVGEKRADAFKKIGINKLEDFLKFIPRSYINKILIKDIQRHNDTNVIVSGRIIDIAYPGKVNHPLRIFLNDGTGCTEIPIFGRSEFRAKQFQLDDKFLFWGKITEGFYNKRFQLNYRDHLKINESIKSENDFLKLPLVPVYELQGVLKKTWIKPLLLSKIVFNAFLTLIESNTIKETIPASILTQGNYISKKDAIIKINFPKDFEDVETARRRLAFEELFFLELILALKKRNIRKEQKGISFTKSIDKLIESFNSSLAFELTQAQKRVMNEIFKDMNSDHVMNRLLQGDVGSGKTIVSIFAMLVSVENGYQSALMCPTELLAEQHYKTISEFIQKFNNASGSNHKVVLLVGGQKKKFREELLHDIKNGKTNIIVGTHALIQEKVEYNNLGFVVIDEQHKFGVMQRAKLKEKGLNPDVLVMTATPIPRTLSLTFYGDLDVSVIDELPKNRKKIKTVLRKENDKPKIFEFIKDKIKTGRQVYFVYPLIDESEKLDLKSAEENYIKLKESYFKDYDVGMVHGRIFSYEKDEQMQAFKEGKIEILVSTTVIEVGIDIPNATIMIVEEAQRFGLSQLHQLRGRVGRGAEQSYCILIGKNLDEISRKRLNILCQSTDGFEIAEEDLKIRGPGEFFGIRQSGVLNFSCTELNKDQDILMSARNIAFKIIDDDPHLRKLENEVVKKEFFRNYKDSLYLMKIA